MEQKQEQEQEQNAPTSPPLPPWRLTATEALHQLRTGTLTVESYALSLLSRITHRDPQVHAWTHLSPALILHNARALDALPASARGPLHGLPVAVKDVLLTADMPTRHNSALYAHAAPSGVDAACIMTLRAAGALIFGKTSTTEFAAVTVGGVRENQTRNAWARDRTPGGSSSGSGAAVGDCQIPVAVGTQTGGSTVRPGAFNGVWAWKPTWGAVSREGCAQYSVSCDTVGFYARSGEDLEGLARVFRVQDDEAVGGGEFEVRGARIGFCRTHVWGKAGPGTVAAWERAKELLGKHGAEVSEVELPGEFEKIAEWHGDVLSGEGRTSFLGNYLLGGDQLHESIRAHVDNERKLSRKAQLEAYDNVARLRPVWDEIASKYDAIITPSVVDEAPLGLESTGDASFCCMWTILHAPCLNVPGFVGANGMPIGLTITGPRYHDLHGLHVGKAIGKIFEAEGGWHPVYED